MKEIFNNIRNSVEEIPEDQLWSFRWLLFAALVLYCQQAWVPGFFMDGYLYAAFGKNAAELGHWLIPFQSESQYARFDQHPPTFFILEGLFFKIFGSGFTSARLFGALWGIGIVIFLYRFLKKANSKEWAYYAVLIFLLLPSFMKKVRFPNLDIPLTLMFVLAYASYYQAFLKDSWKLWLATGMFFGLAMLVKGPPALAIPLGIVLHLILTKKLSKLLSMKSWCGLFLGLTVFAIWPLTLKQTGNYEIFDNYLNGQLKHTIVDGRGAVSTDYFLYLKHLLETAPIWLICFFCGFWKYKKEGKIDSLFLLFLSWFLAIFVPFSLVKFKYSHYILPAMPAFAALAAFALKDMKLKIHKRVHWGFSRLIVFASLLLLIFPLTTQSKRHQELFKVASLLEKIEEKPKSWIVVDGAYGYWGVSNFSSYVYGANPYQVDRSFLQKTSIQGQMYAKQIVFVRKSLWEKEKISHPEVSRYLTPLVYFPAKDLIVLLDHSLAPETFIVK